MANSAELILNSNGSIYHLGLHPEQVAPLIITVGDPARVGRISRYFDRIEHRVRRREFVTHTGWLGRHRLSVISTGIGTDNIDIVLNELDALFSFTLKSRTLAATPTILRIIRLGTTGGLQADIPVDTFVASAGAFGMDGLMQFYDAPAQHRAPQLTALRQHTAGQWDFPVAPYYAPADRALLQTVTDTCQVGYTATNSGFYGPQGRQLRAPVRFAGYLDLLQSYQYDEQRIINLEMETAGIYGLSALLGHQALSLSVVLANRPRGEFSRQPERAVRRLIQMALEKVPVWADL
jgi:uridine phosphorylase